MKKIILNLLSFFLIHIVNAQQNFQGEITYRLHASMRSKPDATLKIYFGSNKIKMRFMEKEEYDKEQIIVLLDSAAKYVINTEDKTYRKKPLAINSIIKKEQNKRIAGYSTTAFGNENTGLASLFGGSMQSANVVFYLADSLQYKIPAIYEGNAELIAIQKNKIVLGADIVFKAGAYEVSDSTVTDDLVTVEAIEIRTMKINDAEFNIPADYIDAKTKVAETVVDTIAADTATLLADTTVVSYPAKKEPVKKPAKPNKPKTPVKSEAIRGKD